MKDRHEVLVSRSGVISGEKGCVTFCVGTLLKTGEGGVVDWEKNIPFGTGMEYQSI